MTTTSPKTSWCPSCGHLKSAHTTDGCTTCSCPKVYKECPATVFLTTVTEVDYPHDIAYQHVHDTKEKARAALAAWCRANWCCDNWPSDLDEEDVKPDNPDDNAVVGYFNNYFNDEYTITALELPLE